MDSVSELADNNKIISSRAMPLCRYGCGCTHMMDPVHREKFRHPNVPKLNGWLLVLYCIDMSSHLLSLSNLDYFTVYVSQSNEGEQLQSQFICNECGFATKSIPELQVRPELLNFYPISVL